MSIDRDVPLAGTQLIARRVQTRVREQSVLISWRDRAGLHEHTLTSIATIGSSHHAALAIEDETVSRIHAEIVPREDGLFVRDLGSRNGCFVGRSRVESAWIPDASSFLVGRTEISVSQGARPRVASTRGLVGASPGMRELVADLSRVAKTDSSVLVTGETGTGKELVARALHEESARADGPFVVVDCGALPETLLEAELFGHARAAFTGATNARIGAFEAAHGGTVFLDEIGELPLVMQSRLLRFIEARTVRRIGETAERPIDVRVVAATHRDLSRMVDEGSFREDLYFRIAVLPIVVPPLRERPGDIRLLLERFLGGAATELAEGDLARLEAHSWPGNVRELRALTERIRAIGKERALALTLERRQLAATAEIPASEERSPSAVTVPPADWLQGGFKEFRDRWCVHGEREYLRRLMQEVNWSVSAAAARAGLERTYLHRLLKRLGV